ncbi:MAG: nucleotidyl transferase AbiEii/AbiGii toxin family protein [Candidatus Omnitrophica bacterium]|nr:nucleotidyl transferase AbiEii/AbiGii toxin family protein [Candidatus Omnitrophota bacterium]
MDQIVRLPHKEKTAYFEVAAAGLNLPPEFIEKDFWVCWMLKQLFSLDPLGKHLTFKGGTSLSKCYNAIQRFSEDIDVSIERSFLSSNGNIDPIVGESNKENKRRLSELRRICQAEVRQTFLPALKEKIKSLLGDNNQWVLELDPDDPDRQTVLFYFPNAPKGAGGGYVRPYIKVEFGARSDHWPVESVAIVPYVASVVSGTIHIEETILRVLAAERTFWEKVTILHMLYHYPEGKAIPPRMSRHYYDVYAMSSTPIFQRALDRIELLKHVADHKDLFFKSSWARYHEAQPGTLRLVPRGADQMKYLKNDYRQMNQMFFKDPPLFDDIMEGLKEIEGRIKKTHTPGV